MPNAVVGIVTDNVDPDKLGRVKVKFPTLVEEPLSYWLRVSAPNGSKDRGFYSLPEKDDEVLVMFMQGSQDVGLIMGQFWNGKDKPPVEAFDSSKAGKNKAGSGLSTAEFTPGTANHDKNDRRLWKSRSGHLFMFDDSAGKETVSLWDKTRTMSLVFDVSKKEIQLSQTDGDIHIRASKDIYIDAGKNIKFKAGVDILGESVSNTKLKVGTNFEMTAGTNATMKAGTAFAISGGATFEAKSPASTLKGDATVTIKGGIVNIN